MRPDPAARWVPGFASAAIAVAYWAYMAHFQQMDFQAYRMGAQHVFGPGLYSAEITVLGRHLYFTYPPVAAMLFWPLSHLSVFAGQTIWDAANLVALTALIAVSMAAARSRSVVRLDWRTALMLLAPVGFFLYPVRYDLALGQINIVLVLMIVADLTVGVSWRGRSLPTGVLVGLAAAIKLTPLVFIPYLVLSRQWRSGRNAALAFVLATGAMFAVSPRASWLFFTRDAFDVRRIGDSALATNQSLHAAISRAHLSPSPLLFGLIWVIVLCVGVGLAVTAYRRSSALLATLLCAATGLMLSPVSWVHHYVWIVPALVWVMVGVDRPAYRVGWASAVALPFVLIPPKWAETSRGVPLYVTSNAYVIWTLAFYGLIGVMLWLRRSQSVSDHQPAATTDASGACPRRPMSSSKAYWSVEASQNSTTLPSRRWKTCASLTRMLRLPRLGAAPARRGK